MNVQLEVDARPCLPPWAVGPVHVLNVFGDPQGHLNSILNIKCNLKYFKCMYSGWG